LWDYSIDPWYESACLFKKNISVVNVKGTETINVTVKNGTINALLSYNASNFTFADASETSKLNFLVDYILAPQTAGQEIQFFVNNSNNESIWLYSGCNFTTSQETRTTGRNGGVMQYYENFDGGMGGWHQVGAGGESCSLVNGTYMNISGSGHGNRMGAQALYFVGGGKSGGCMSDPLDIYVANGSSVDSLWWEWLGTVTSGGNSDARYASMGVTTCGDAFPCSGAMSWSKINTPTLGESSWLFYEGSWQAGVNNPLVGGHNNFARLRIFHNMSVKQTPNLANGNLGATRAFTTNFGTPPNSGISALYAGTDGGMNGWIDDVKIWNMNFSTVVSYSPVEQNVTPTPPSDTCTYVSGNWNVRLGDNCTVVANLDMGTGLLNLSGTSGMFTVAANLTVGNFSFVPSTVDGSGIFRIVTGASFRIKKW
jgi:hypothetical protein